MPLTIPPSYSPMRYRQTGTNAATSGPTANRYHIAGMWGGANLNGTFTTVVGTTHAMPFYTGSGGILESAQIRLVTGSGSSTAHIAIYANTSDTVLYPSTKIYATSDFATTASSAFAGATGLAQPLPPDSLVWVTIQTSAILGITALPTSAQWPILGHSQDATNYAFSGTCLIGTGSYTTPPTTFQTDAVAGTFSNIPAIWLRFA